MLRKFKLNEIVSIRDKNDLFLVIEFLRVKHDPGNPWYRVENMADTRDRFTLNEASLNKYLQYHNIWNQICLN